MKRKIILTTLLLTILTILSLSVFVSAQEYCGSIPIDQCHNSLSLVECIQAYNQGNVPYSPYVSACIQQWNLVYHPDEERLIVNDLLSTLTKYKSGSATLSEVLEHISRLNIYLNNRDSVSDNSDSSYKNPYSLIDKIIKWFQNLTKKDVSYLNEFITQKYAETNSFSYDFDEMNYLDGTKREYVSKFKRPDMIITESEGIINICNENSYYTLYRGNSPMEEQELFSKMPAKRKELGTIKAKEWFAEEENKIQKKELIHEYRYTNLPVEIKSYCSWAIDNGLHKFLIPSDLSDTSKYKTNAIKGKINGKTAIIIRIEILDVVAEETKDKLKKDGLTYYPKEPLMYKIYVDANDYSIIKEEGYENNKLLFERKYNKFEFNPEISDEEFKVDENRITSKELVDLTEKFLD